MEKPDIPSSGSAAVNRPGTGIRRRLFITFTGLFFLLIAGIQALNFFGIPRTRFLGLKTQFENNALHGINIAADNKKDRIIQWLEERKGDMITTTKGEWVINNVEQLLRAYESLAGENSGPVLWEKIQGVISFKRLAERMELLRTAYGFYTAILIADAKTGTVVFSTDLSDLGKTISKESYFQAALSNRDAYLSSLMLDDRGGRPIMFVSGGVREKETGGSIEESRKAVMAVLVAKADTATFFESVLHAGEALGASWEALIVDRNATIQYELENAPAADVRAEPLKYRILAKPAILAASGEERNIEAMDYRGVRVLATTRQIRFGTGIQWGMVVKQDKSEINAGFRRMFAKTLFFTIGAFVFILIVIGVVSGNISRPIMELTRTAEKVAQGDLSGNAKVSTRDEIGYLAAVFNNMVRQIREWTGNLEDQVKSRSAAIIEANTALMAEIAERKQAEEAVNVERQRLKDLLELLPVYVALLSPDYHMPFANRFFRERFGESSGRRCFEFLFGRTEPCEVCETYTVLKTGAPHEWEWTGPDGRNYQVFDYPFTDTDGSILIMEMGIDITERKQAENALRTSEERLIDAQRLAHIGNWEINLASNNLVWSDEIYNIFEIEKKDFGASYDAFLAAIHPDDRAGVDKAYNDSLKNREPYEIIHRLLMPDGRIKYVHERCETQFDPDGNPIRSVGTVQDITERKRAEESLRAAGAYNRSLIEAGLDPLVTIGPDGRITDVNASTEAVTGYSREKLIGTDFSDYFTDTRNARAGYEQVFRDGSVHDYPLEIMSRDGCVTPVLYNATVYRDEKGQVVGVFAAVHDITQLKQAQLEQEKLREQLVQSQKMEAIGRLAGGIAHDFNNVLTAIMGHAVMGLRKAEPDSFHQRAYTEIQKAGERARDLTMNLLTFARKEKANLRNTSMSPILEELVSILRRSISKKIKIKTVLSPNLPPVNADSNQLHLAFLNICNNACDAMPDGGMLTIESGRCVIDETFLRNHADIATGEYCLVQISDTGTGMTEDEKAKIFDPFFTTKPMGKGTGLGLSMTYGAIRNHHGFIDVYSELGVGTVMKTYLPFAPGADEIAGEKADSGIVMSKGSETILVVDDEKPVLDIAQMMLNEAGYNTIIANGGEQGLEIYKNRYQEISLAIIDFNMPELDGADLYRAMKEINPNVKVVLSSGFSPEGQAGKLLSEGVIAFIQKPFDFVTLCDIVRNSIDA